MNIDPYGKLAKSTLDKFESQIGFTLPDDYQHFILQTNGGRVVDQTFYIEEVDTHVLMHVFYGLGVEKNKILNLDFWLEKYGDEIPEESLLIGNDQGGGFILYVVGGEDFGVYYYDHAHLLEESSEEKNTYFLADTFREFVDSFVSI